MKPKSPSYWVREIAAGTPEAEQFDYAMTGCCVIETHDEAGNVIIEHVLRSTRHANQLAEQLIRKEKNESMGE